MKKKQFLTHILSAVLSFAIGISVINAVFYYKYAYKDNIGVPDFSKIKEFDNENIWQNVYKYYTEEMENDIDSYHRIYSSNSLSKYLDMRLEPYYEKYGYEVVLTSAIKNKHTYSKIYAMEKCISIVGSTKINRSYISEILDEIKITDNNTTKEESEYCEYAKKRLALAKALTKENFKSDSFIKSSLNNVFVWIEQPFGGYGKLKTYSDGEYYSYKDLSIDINSTLEFITKDMLKVFSDKSNAYIITFRDETIIYDIKEMIRTEWELLPSTDINIESVNYDGHTIKGSFFCTNSDMLLPDVSVTDYILYPDTGKFEIQRHQSN